MVAKIEQNLLGDLLQLALSTQHTLPDQGSRIGEHPQLVFLTVRLRAKRKTRRCLGATQSAQHPEQLLLSRTDPEDISRDGRCQTVAVLQQNAAFAWIDNPG